MRQTEVVTTFHPFVDRPFCGLLVYLVKIHVFLEVVHIKFEKFLNVFTRDLTFVLESPKIG
jgi:hypothetical protein